MLLINLNLHLFLLCTFFALAHFSLWQGLNAILDHRAEVFIPELGNTFKCPSSFRVFACQNPSHQGGGRKGLPKSFLNRFTKVCRWYVFLVFILGLWKLKHRYIQASKPVESKVQNPLCSTLIQFMYNRKKLYLCFVLLCLMKVSCFRIFFLFS